MKIQVKTMLLSDTIEFNHSTTIKDVKNMIKTTFGIAQTEQVLHLNGNILLNDENKLLKSYNISEASVISVKVHFSKFKVYVNLPNGKVFDAEVKSTDKIHHLKSIIEKQSSYKVSEQVFLIKEKELASDKTFAECGITNQTTINMVPRVCAEMKQVIVRLDEGQVLEIDVTTETTGKQLKQKISESIRINQNDIKLKHNTDELRDNDAMQKMPGGLVSLQMTSNTKITPIQILVKTYDNRTIQIRICKNLKCIELKKKVIEKIGGLIEEAYLTFNGFPLDDEKFLDDYPLINNSVVDYLIKLYGGVRMSLNHIYTAQEKAYL